MEATLILSLGLGGIGAIVFSESAVLHLNLIDMVNDFDSTQSEMYSEERVSNLHTRNWLLIIASVLLGISVAVFSLCQQTWMTKESLLKKALCGGSALFGSYIVLWLIVFLWYKKYRTAT